MDIRHINETYHVSPQIAPGDVAAIAAAGITTIICNRPDSEIPQSVQAAAVSAAAQAEGLAFHILPLTHQSMTPENIQRQADLVSASEGPVLAYCASGTRCTVIWALGQAMTKTRSVDEILAAAHAGGYALDGLRPQLDFLAR